MTGKAGEVQGSELWLRCPECGDSQSNPDKAHLSVNLDRFVYHCFRCGTSGRLSTPQVLSLLQQIGMDLDVHLVETDKDDELGLPELLPGAGSGRPSLLARSHVEDSDQQVWDAFTMRHPRDNTVTGYHLRSGRKKLTLGDRGFGWVSPGPLLSDPSHPLMLVEGPYDVVFDSAVCTFGLLSPFVVRELKGHSIILIPDGDVWQKPHLLARTTKLISLLMSNLMDPYLVGLWHLTSGLDPDEAKDLGWMDYTQYVPRNRLYGFLQEQAKRLSVASISGG